MKAKKFKGTPVPSIGGKGPSNTVTRRQAVALIAAHVPRASDDDEQTVRNRISAAIYDAVKARKLHSVKPGILRLGDLAAWAPSRWPKGRFRDLPTFPNRASAAGTLPGLRGSATAFVHPSTLPAAIEEIIVLRAENAALATELSVVKARVQVLEEQVRRYRAGYEKRKRKPAR